MKIGYAITMYNPGGYLARQLPNILSSKKHEVCVQVYLHNDRYYSLINECDLEYKKYHFDYFPYCVNRGNPTSYNDALHRSYTLQNCDLFITSSQDISFNTPTAFDEWIDKALPYIDEKYAIGYTPNTGPDGAPFACLMITTKGFNAVGYADENLFPAQYDDSDLHRRLSLAFGDNPDNFHNPKYRIDIQADGTHECMSVRKDPLLLFQQQYITGPLNKRYYDKKWGLNTYTLPFNNSDFNLYISYENRKYPYGVGYDRTDRDMVVI